jgi:hypothetical protein
VNLTVEQKQSLQEFYLSCRHLLASGLSSEHFVKRSFEEMLAGVRLHEAWRPTHISRSAADEIIAGRKSNVQRAHGVIPGRLDRHARTISLLRGDAKPFDEWWEFFCLHDSTVLVTKREHNEGLTPSLIELPAPEQGLFASHGFKVRIRQTSEIAWLKSTLAGSFIVPR